MNRGEVVRTVSAYLENAGGGSQFDYHILCYGILVAVGEIAPEVAE